MRSVIRGLVRGAGLGVVPAALLLTAVTGCSGEPAQDRPADSAAPSRKQDPAGSASEKAVAKGSSLGGPGSPCPLPVAFDLAAGWKAEPVASGEDELGLLEQGTVTLVCEVDAKPAGHIGFLRVWKGGEKGEDARTALKAFVEDEADKRGDEKYSDLTLDGLAAAEVSYVNTSALVDEPKRERALAVATPKGVVVLHLGGLDTEEHDDMLPAYLLARKSLKSG
ncbi:lipoprotein [Streptomyces fructofermentans]|uniref:lipoprotein n=1 Tax=Streptomyces fructofermentans TaxID=152141 RepID=UPI00379FDF97